MEAEASWEIVVIWAVPAWIDQEPTKYWFASEAKAVKAYTWFREQANVISLKMYRVIPEVME